MKTTHPEVSPNCRKYRFRGRGQRLTPVMADTRSIVELILALPGRHAARVRRQAAKLLVRYLGGDLSLVDEVCALRGLQEELAVRAPEDPARAFGEAVEAAPPAEYLSRVCGSKLVEIVDSACVSGCPPKHRHIGLHPIPSSRLSLSSSSPSPPASLSPPPPPHTRDTIIGSG